MKVIKIGLRRHVCFRQFEDWIFQPPLNLLMFRFLPGRHSKALQGSWNPRSSSLETCWAELKARTCGCSLAPRTKRGEDESIIWMVLPALPIPRSPSTEGPLPFVFWERGLAAKRAPSPLALSDGVYVFPPPALPWGRYSQPFFDCVTHSWRRVQPEDKSLTACSFFSWRLWGEWSMLCFKASLLSEPQRKRDYKEPI